MKRVPMPAARVSLARATTLRRLPVTPRKKEGRQPAQRPAKPSKPAGWGQDTRETVQRRSGGVCEVAAVGCLGRATNLHHRLPTRMGGSRNPALRTAANALHVCGMGNASGCHRFVDECSKIAELAGWKLHAGADPLTEPVRYRCRSLVWLLEDGRMVGEVQP